ncbi:MAG: hypothetical protein QXX38_03260 [Candidatus Aenigmatarchaeota archaeon]
MREHAFDPLRGLIAMPEETHGFFGRAAVEKRKAEEWEGKSIGKNLSLSVKDKLWP